MKADPMFRHDFYGLDYHHSQIATVIKLCREDGADDGALREVAKKFLRAFKCAGGPYVNTKKEQAVFMLACGFPEPEGSTKC